MLKILTCQAQKERKIRAEKEREEQEYQKERYHEKINFLKTVKQIERNKMKEYKEELLKQSVISRISK